MAVTNFHYITRMSSGFKVYILEGQPHLRSEDRYRHMTNERARTPAVYPVKRKRSHERCLTLEERRERVLSRSNGKAAQTSAPAPAPVPVPAAAMFNSPRSPTSTWSPTPSPTSPLPTHVYYAPVMDEPLALIKKPRKDSESTEDKIKNTPTTQIQMRPSVITCVSSLRNPTSRSDVDHSQSSVISKCNYDHVVEEHFQRSLGANYQKAHSQQLSISVSVDDHFAKALGDKWLQIKSKSSSCSSTPPSSPSITHSPAYRQSPHPSHKESTSNSSPTSSHWSVN
ncbi:vestigial like 4 like [Dunckerocampus dactyliophorus]|uniref:vestigial like 4 like n=1 Tax=Dunckerocampus dactyliophorus TaxID=161453 RepID=UPI002406B8F5|nr:vestigial like 4 like [Dunckerocampus dactyliophorus]XP_054629687.1 vestigial like 4 like [Dunckerocampus dactyliophorus]